MEKGFETITGKLLEHGILGLVVVLMVMAIVVLFRRYDQLQDARAADGMKLAEELRNLKDAVRASAMSFESMKLSFDALKDAIHYRRGRASE